MTEPKLESIQEITDYLDVKYKTKLLWANFTKKKRDDEWYKKNTPLPSSFVNENDGQGHLKNWHKSTPQMPLDAL